MGEGDKRGRESRGKDDRDRDRDRDGRDNRDNRNNRDTRDNRDNRDTRDNRDGDRNRGNNWDRRNNSESEDKWGGRVERKSKFSQWDDEPRERKSKWNPEPAPSVPLPGTLKWVPAGIPMEIVDLLILRIRVDELTRKLAAGQLDLDDQPGRPPSPEPIYNSSGARVNTREQRAKDKVLKERTALIEEAIRLNPAFRPPSDYKQENKRLNRKVYIPYREHPEYNFIGLIIGPRGNTQKRMERETGAKIAIRGKGSIKEGKLGRRDGKQNDGEDEDLHVLITADNRDALDRAAIMVEQLLVPVAEGQNKHKQDQLRELAVINGTLRDKNWRDFEPRSFDSANVVCGICNEPSHPTSDCPLRGKSSVPSERKAVLDADYQAFLAEIGETDPAPPQNPTKEVEQSYEAFMAEIQGGAPEKKEDPDVEQSYNDFMAEIGDGVANGAKRHKPEPAPVGYPPQPYPHPPYGYPPPPYGWQGWAPSEAPPGMEQYAYNNWGAPQPPASG